MYKEYPDYMTWDNVAQIEVLKKVGDTYKFVASISRDGIEKADGYGVKLVKRRKPDDYGVELVQRRKPVA